MAEFTTMEIAAMCNKSERQVQRWIKGGKLKAQHIGANRYEVDERDLAPFLPRETVENYMERIETLESHIVELASRVSTLEAVISTMQQEQPKILKPARPTYETKHDTPAGVPPGAIKMRTFAEKHAPLTRDWLMPLIESKDIPNTDIPYGSRHQYWFLPEHLPVIVAYIQAHPHIPFGPCDDPTCPCHA